jgi:methionine-rich copper-binding protein CopC
MKNLKSILLAAVVASLAMLLGAVSAQAATVPPSVTINTPAANAFVNTVPALTFSTTGTGLTKSCSLTGPGVSEFEDGCDSGYKPLESLAEGAYTYSISVENSGGLAAKSVSFTVDKTVPVVALSGGLSEGASVNATSVTITATITDTNAKYLNCMLDSDLWEDCYGPGGSATVTTKTWSGLAEGGHKFWFAATDKAGNMTIVNRNVTIDRTAPTVNISTNWGTETRDVTPAFLLSSSDAFTITSKECRVVGQSDFASCAGSAWVYNDGLVDGAYTAEFKVTDAAGNSTTDSQAFTVDATLPTITHGGFVADKTTETKPEIDFYVDDAHATTSRCGFDATDWDQLVDCAEGLHAPAAALALGTHSFWIDALDTFGNHGSTVYTFEVVAPTVPGPTPGTGTGTGTGGQTGGQNPAAVVVVKTKSGKVVSGRFIVTASVKITGATCAKTAKLTLKTYRTKLKLASKGGACVGSVKVKLPAKLKGKKVGVSVVLGGNTLKAVARKI